MTTLQKGKPDANTLSTQQRAALRALPQSGPDTAVPAEVNGFVQEVAGSGLVAPGKLGSATEDTMTLHTREALRVFTGRAADARRRMAPLPGGRHFAAALKSIWYLSGHDNPYADWILIRVYDGLLTLRARIAELTFTREAVINEIRRKGLSLALLESAIPVRVALGFRSPYGYAVAETIVEFDYYVRLVQTLVYKDRLSDVDGRADIRALSHSLYALFRKPLRWERLLLREELKPLTRQDFRPDADARACQRVAAATALFGKLPRNILLGSEQPRHSRRRTTLAVIEPVRPPQPSLPSAERVGQAEADAVSVALPEHCPAVAANVSRETHDAAGANAATVGTAQ